MFLDFFIVAPISTANITSWDNCKYCKLFVRDWEWTQGGEEKLFVSRRTLWTVPVGEEEILL